MYFFYILAVIGSITGILGLIISVFGVFLSNRRTRESNSISIQEYRHSVATKEVEIIDKYYDLIYRSEHGKKIIEACKHKKPVLKSNKGSVTERELENFLNDILHLFSLATEGLIRITNVKSSFGWVMERIHESDEIINYITQVQRKYNYPYYQMFIDFSYVNNINSKKEDGD